MRASSYCVRGSGRGVSAANALDFDVQGQRQLAGARLPHPPAATSPVIERGERQFRLEAYHQLELFCSRGAFGCAARGARALHAAAPPILPGYADRSAPDRLERRACRHRSACGLSSRNSRLVSWSCPPRALLVEDEDVEGSVGGHGHRTRALVEDAPFIRKSWGIVKDANR